MASPILVAIIDYISQRASSRVKMKIIIFVQRGPH